MYTTTLLLHAIPPAAPVELKIAKTVNGEIDLWLSNPRTGKADCRLNAKEVAQILAVINS